MTTKLQDKHLAEVVRRCRCRIFDILEIAKYGHSGGSLSSLEILVSLFFEVANIDPSRPKWESRDRVVISKAHVVEGIYAVLAERGFFPASDLKKYLEFGSFLQGHAERSTPGVEYSGGSLAQGISYACGVALAGKLRGSSYRVYCVLGDAECHEGQVWEAAMMASHYGLDNVCAVVDYNHYGDHNDVNKLMRLEPFIDKWRDFGWEAVYELHGNDLGAITSNLRLLQTRNGRPKVLIANTVKNNGVPRWERLHSHLLSGEELAAGIEEGRKIWGCR